MKKAELRAFFRDLRERMDNVSPDPDAQRFDYQTIAINALTAIKQVIDTGLEEDADQLHNAYHNGYEQGRFDKHADQIGREKAEKLKERIDKQKNCPYCHYPWEKIPIENLEDDDEAFYFEQYETNGPHKLMKTIKVLHNDDVAPWPIAVNHRPKHCEMCGRPLNEEEE